MTETSTIDTDIAESNAYDMIQARLSKQGEQLETLTRALNEARLSEFQSTQMEVIGRLRVRTENNCVPRNIVPVGEYLLFGYNVYIGLKKETRIEDVFTLFQLSQQDGQFELKPTTIDHSFLTNPVFINDFRELYSYYKHTRLLQLVVKDNRLLAAFQIGERITDIRVFRWGIDSNGELSYIDNRGERDIALPDTTDFLWQATVRMDSVHGRYPHINILDTLFVETIGGDLTIKVEDNTDSGLGIYNEDVVDKTQSLDDAKIFYAEVGQLILLKILPYREEQWRYLVFNRLTDEVQRIDAIGASCIHLPEDHGIIFPGGIYLENGGLRQFEHDLTGMRFKRRIRSPNGEDVLYLFYEPVAGRFALFAYNLIEKNLNPPIFAHGYALAENGEMVLFSTDSDEPTRIHPMQIWSTPFFSEEYASQQPISDSPYARIGNAELVRGISDLYSIARSIRRSEVSSNHYHQLIQNSKRLFESYYWLDQAELADTKKQVQQIIQTAESVLDEFEKVASIRAQAQDAMQAAEAEQKVILSALLTESWQEAEPFVDALNRIRRQRGHLITLREYRYIDRVRLTELDQTLSGAQDQLAADTLSFLASDEALKPYEAQLTDLEQELEKAETALELSATLQAQDKMAADLDVLSELMTTLQVDDANMRTRVIESISGIYSKLNQLRARTRHKQKDLGKAEAIAQFGVQFKLLTQSMTHALGLANTPEQCDEQLGRLWVQLEELESQFSEYDDFLVDILAKREEIHEAFESHKQTLLNERQRRAQNLTDAAQRILSSLQRRTQALNDMDQLNTFFASDALVMKVRDIVSQLRELEDSVRADDLESALKNHQEQAIRRLRDKQDIYEDGGQVIKLGKHRFSVTTQMLDLTLMPREEQQYIHLSGTDFFEAVQDPVLDELRFCWEQSLPSETPGLYRAEYLAGQLLEQLNKGKLDSEPERLSQSVQQWATQRYQEGYEKGIHDHDALEILKQVIPAQQKAGLLRFSPLARGLAAVFWQAVHQESFSQNWPDRAKAAGEMRRVFGNSHAFKPLQQEITQALTSFIADFTEQHLQTETQNAATYLCEVLSTEPLRFEYTQQAKELVTDLKQALNVGEALGYFEQALDKLTGQPAQHWQYIETWLQALLSKQTARIIQEDEDKFAGTEESASEVVDTESPLAHYIPEAIAMISLNEQWPQLVLDVDTEITVPDILGEHPLIHKEQGKRFLRFSLDQWLSRYHYHQQQVVPAYKRYLQRRAELVEQHRDRLKLENFTPKPLASFVRNRLLNEAYLPLIGDNLAKQMGAAGQQRRSDQMGLLLLISPPGYGKTTLMEYVANRLGLIFMKVNCPSLGHSVVSLDPEQAPDASSAQELMKLNLGLEMGNNVMLYLDDIQHTHPEFLQKFISLADGTRRIDGIWQGKSKTYDLRGKRFCIIMAGNPYTEAGETFKIPDMLANRADVYNLGEVLGNKQDVFALSYLENCLTSNPVLAPLATRPLDDVYHLIEWAQGKTENTNELQHPYNRTELNEIINIFQKLILIQSVILKVNQAYIASAAQNDAYRTEPPFKLQGSYRNMNKMAEKVSAAMNEEELLQLIADHYQGEAQLLSSGSEENLLKLAELRGNMTEAESQRWEVIKEQYQRNQLSKKADVQIGLEIASRLGDLHTAFQGGFAKQTADQAALQDGLKQAVTGLSHIQQALLNPQTHNSLTPQLKQISTTLQQLGTQVQQALNQQPKAEQMILPHLSQVNANLESLSQSLAQMREHGTLAEPLAQIAAGIQGLGEELAEVSNTSSKKLSWLTGKK